MWILVMVSLIGDTIVAEKISIHPGIADCYAAITEQEFEYDFKTLNRDWVCVRKSGNWDYSLRY
mgnify:FL=1|jgi:hypothetical protein